MNTALLVLGLALGATRSTPMQLDVGALSVVAPGDRLDVTLFEGVAFIATVDDRQTHAADRFTISGTIAGHADASFILAVHGAGVAGHFELGDLGTYRLRHRDDGLHVEQVDPGADFACGVEGHRGLDAGAVPAPGGIAGGCDDGSVIDVLMIYTPEARDEIGGVAAMEAELDLFVAYNNQAYVNSEINTVWNLVYAWQLPPGPEPLLFQLTDPADGIIDEVHDLREAYGADQVALIRAGTGGVANGLFTLDPAEAATAFCVNGIGSGPFITAHEIGHNLGCCHAIGDGGGCVGKGLLFEYSNGYRFFGDSGQEWRTIMAYSPGSRIQHLSNPDVLFDGQPIGIPIGQPQAADNATTINLSAFTVSNWRCNNGICEALDLPSDAADCNDDGLPDACEVALALSPDGNNNGVPDECDPPCPWDLDNSGDVATTDFLILLSEWGDDGPADFDNSGAVDTLDFLELLANWGPC